MDPGGSGSRSATRAFEGFEGFSASRHGPSVRGETRPRFVGGVTVGSDVVVARARPVITDI
jgi:hypothetical protein